MTNKTPKTNPTPTNKTIREAMLELSRLSIEADRDEELTDVGFIKARDKALQNCEQALLTYIKEEQEKARHEVIDLMVENLKDTYQKIFMYETIYGAMYDPDGEIDVVDSYVKYQELEPERAKFADWLESQRNRLEQS